MADRRGGRPGGTGAGHRHLPERAPDPALANHDDAFTRRLDMVTDFPALDEGLPG